MYKHDQRVLWGRVSRPGGCLAPSPLGFWDSQSNELQKRCWNSQSRWRANPTLVALPSFGSILLLLQPFFYISICGRCKTKELRDLQGWWPWGELSAAVVCSGLSASLPRQWYFASIKERAWALRARRSFLCFPTLFLHELYAQMGVRMHICTSISSMPPKVSAALA